MYSSSSIDSPIGTLIAIASDTHLLMLEFADSENLERKIDSFGFVILTKEGSAPAITEQIPRASE